MISTINIWQRYCLGRPGAGLVIVVLCLLLWSTTIHVAGQATDPWTTPLNLSQSGSAAEPQIVSDNENKLHALWQDSVENGFVHAYSGEEGWSQPLSVEVPFGTRRFFPDLQEDDPTPLFQPHLVADGEGFIHAVWIDDEVGTLFHSRVPAGEFDSFAAWSSRAKVAESALSLDLSLGPDGRLHVVYLQSVDISEHPAGLYYRQSADKGESWSSPIMLHQSSYFRLLTLETANVQLARNGQGHLYVAWDDWPYERVFVVRSPDSGLTWETPVEIDRREEKDSADAPGPANIRIAATNESVQVTWQAAHAGLPCAQYNSWSQDGGQNWQPRQQILDTPSDCPTQVQFVDSSDTIVLLATTATDGYLMAWDGLAWQAPEAQPALVGFTDSQTYRPIAYTCGQTVLIQGETLWVISCGVVDISQDIWLQQRSLTALREPAEATPLWQPAAVLVESQPAFVSPVLVADEANRLHAFWNQPLSESEAPFGPRTPSIYYSRWEAGRWSSPVAMLSSPEGNSEQPAVAVDGRGRILVVWSGATNGEIHFSWASTEQAILSTGWTTPQQLPMPQGSASAPVIGVDGSGVIYVAYAVPLNEGRGIYLVKSLDEGQTWSEPLPVFDGAAAGWEIVGEPRLAIGGTGQLHLLWLHQPAPSTPGGASLYYSYSTDGGESWASAQEVTSESSQGAPVLWHQIVSPGGGIVHRVWQEWYLGRLYVWHQPSRDYGATWDPPAQITALDNLRVPATLTVDGAGQVHLIYVHLGIAEADPQPASLHHWVWQGEEWEQEESLRVDQRAILSTQALGAAVSPEGRLAALFSGVVEGEDVLEGLFFSERRVALPAVTPTPLPPPTATPMVTPSPSPEATAAPTATVVFPLDSESPNDQVNLGPLGSAAGLIAGVAAVILVVGVTFVVLAVSRARSIRIRH